MMEYGHIINGQLIKPKIRTEQDKLLTYTDEPTIDESHATSYYWEDNGKDIIQVWETYEIEPIEEIDDLTDTQALSIILGESND